MKVLRILLLIVVVFVLPLAVHAQATFGSSTDVPDLPIDGGISLLVAAGVGYGARKLLKKKKTVGLD